MLTTEECPEMNIGTGKFSDDVEMTVEQLMRLTMYSGSEFQMEEAATGKARPWLTQMVTQRTVLRTTSAYY